MAQRALCACVGQGAADVVLLGPPWDRSQARFLLSACLLVLCCVLPETGPGVGFCNPFLLVLFLPVLRYLLFLGTFPYLLYPALRVSDTQFVDLPIRVPDTQFVSYRTGNCSNHESFTGP